MRVLRTLLSRTPLRTTVELLAASACGGALGFFFGPVGVVAAGLLGVALGEFWHRTGRLAPKSERGER